MKTISTLSVIALGIVVGLLIPKCESGEPAQPITSIRTDTLRITDTLPTVEVRYLHDSIPIYITQWRKPQEVGRIEARPDSFIVDITVTPRTVTSVRGDSLIVRAVHPRITPDSTVILLPQVSKKRGRRAKIKAGLLGVGVGIIAGLLIKNNH